jgi:WD40 repeat protein
MIAWALSRPASTVSAQVPIETAAEEANRPRLIVQMGHWGGIQSVMFSFDGRQVLTSSFDNTARLWDVATGDEIRRFQGHLYEVLDAQVSFDGSVVLTGSRDKTARLWDATTGSELRRFDGHTEGVNSVALSQDRAVVLTGSSDKTARLWDAATGKERHSFEGHTEDVSSVAFSPDGRFVLTGSYDNTARLWDVASGERVRSFEGHAGAVNSAIFSHDGRKVLTASSDGTARLWDTTSAKELRSFKGHSKLVTSATLSLDDRLVLTGSFDETARLWNAIDGGELHTFKGHTDAVSSVAFSPDGKSIVTGSWDKSARLWNLTNRTERRKLQGRSTAVASIAFAPNGTQILAGGDDSVRIWDLISGQEAGRFEGFSDNIECVAYSPDGKSMLAGGVNGVAQLLDMQSRKRSHTFNGHSQRITSAAFSSDGKWVTTGSFDRTAKLWDVLSGKCVHTFDGHKDIITSVAFSYDSTLVLTGSFDFTAQAWAINTGQKGVRFVGHLGSIASVAFSSDGKYVLTGSFDRTARLWDAGSGEPIRTFEGHQSDVRSVAFSSDGKYVMTGTEKGAVHLWSVATGAEIRRYIGHSSPVKSIAFSPDGKHLLTGSVDRTVRLWNAATDEEQCSLVSFRNGDWVVIDPKGRFDAANGGNVDGLHWIVGNEPIDLVQLKERYYEPGLLAKKMGFNKEALRDVDTFKHASPYPAATLWAPTPGNTKLRVRLQNRGGGIGRVQVFVNGKELLADARGTSVEDSAMEAWLSIDLAEAHVTPGRPNHVKVVTWNAEGYLSSRGQACDWTPDGVAEDKPPELYAIVCGVSDYASPKLQLRYAAKDAESMYESLLIAARRLFGAKQTHLALLATCKHPRAIPPTKTNLRDVFAHAARRAKATDVLVIYLAGHGVALRRGQDLYCYLTQEARSTDPTVLADPAVLEASAVTSNELVDWINHIATQKQVMLLDTCAAGAAATGLMDHRDLSGDHVRALDRLKDRTGLHVLMGCTADRVSYETNRYGQGVLTYALLQGLQGGVEALREGEYVDVNKWFEYAVDHVPHLARNIGGVQTPRVMAPLGGGSFDVGRLTAKDRAAIPLARIKPMVLRPLLSNAKDGDDDLKILPLLCKRLNDASYATGRAANREPPLVYLDAEELTGAVRPVGQYTVEGAKVVVQLLLKQDGKTLGKLKISGTSDDIPGLATRIAELVTEAVAE